MNLMGSNPDAAAAFNYFALASAIVAIHLFVLAGITGYVRAKRKQFVNPEDAALNKAEKVDDDHPDVLRVKRAHMNLMESAIPFFGVAGLYVMTGATKTGAMAYFGTFVVARVLHTIFYLLGKQPFRTITFVIGAFAVIGMAVHIIRAAM